MHQDDEITSKALDLFDQYADMPRERLNSALEALRRRDAAVHASLLTLLDADAMPYTFASPLQWIATRSEELSGEVRGESTAIWRNGTRLGAWCVDSVIGIGGMGVVYAAHRADGLYEQDIALKTIRSELISPALLAAFAHERSNLARLEHAAIASLVDAGISTDGQPWLAMQRVVGEPIDRWCDAHSSDLRDRVLLLIETCDAITYAHAHGVLHQDIKPSNLLVTGEGKVKLLDFGLSAILTLQGENGFTRIGVSSAYAAPEVFEGASPSVAIDVYALGVVLYRLLCDGWPRKPRTMMEIAQVPNEVSRSPSLLALDASSESARLRGMRDAQALSHALRADLDAIALRCVRREPIERYASVADLRTDLQAWLEHRPVVASDGGWVYRTTRYVLRNAVAVAAAVALASALAGGGWFALQRQHGARLEAENGEILNQLFEKSIGAAALSSLGSTPLSSQALLDDAEQQLRTAAGAGRPQFLARGLDALARAYLVRGDYPKTERLLNEAKVLGVDNALQVARTDAVLAQLFNLQGKSEDAERVVREGLTALPSRRGIQDDLVALDLRMQLAKARWSNGDPYGSIRILDAAVEKAQVLGEAGMPALCELLGQRGYVNSNLYKNDAAQQDLTRALTLIGDRSPPIRNTILLRLTNHLIQSGNYPEEHRLASALLVESLKIYGPSHPETGRAWIVAGASWFYAQDNERSRIALDQGASILGKHVGKYHPDMITVPLFRSAISFANGDLEGASAQSGLALEIAERAYGPRHEITLRRTVNFASANTFLAERAKGAEQDMLYAKAETLLSNAIRIGEQQKFPMWYAYDKYAMVLLHFHRVDEAERQSLRGLRETENIFGKDSNNSLPSKLYLMKVRTAQKRYDDAAKLGSELMFATAIGGLSDYSDYLIMESILDNEIARGDPARIRAEYRRLREFSQQHGFLDSLEAKPVPGVAARSKRQ